MLATIQFRTVLAPRLLFKICKSIILPVVLHGFETLSLTLREEYRLRVSENMVLRRTFGRKREK
jgi:hypothetical protein